MTESTEKPEFKFQDAAGWTFCREVLKKRLPFTPHDYQLEGVTQALDGNDVMAITATGSGKSGYIYMLVMILQELGQNPGSNPSKRQFPSRPAVVVISPTTALEEDQEREMTDLGVDFLRDGEGLVFLGSRCYGQILVVSTLSSGFGRG